MTQHLHHSQVDLPPDQVVAFYNGVRLPPGKTPLALVYQMIDLRSSMILKVGQVTRKRTGRNVPIGSSSTVRKGRMTRWRTSKCTSSSTLAIAGGGDGADGHPHGAARHLIVLRNQRAQDQPLLPTKLPIFKIQPPKVEAVFFLK